MKKMPKFSKLENGDTFYCQINNYSKELDGKYMIFIATGVALYNQHLELK